LQEGNVPDLRCILVKGGHMQFYAVIYHCERGQYNEYCQDYEAACTALSRQGKKMASGDRLLLLHIDCGAKKQIQCLNEVKKR